MEVAIGLAIKGIGIVGLIVLRVRMGEAAARVDADFGVHLLSVTGRFSVHEVGHGYKALDMASGMNLIRVHGHVAAPRGHGWRFNSN